MRQRSVHVLVHLAVSCVKDVEHGGVHHGSETCFATFRHGFGEIERCRLYTLYLHCYTSREKRRRLPDRLILPISFKDEGSNLRIKLAPKAPSAFCIDCSLTRKAHRALADSEVQSDSV